MHRIRSLVVLGTLLAAACSPLHTVVAPDFDWSEVRTMVLEEPARDPYGLLPLVRQQVLQMRGGETSSANAGVDLKVRFFVVETRDLGETGDSFFRPKSLHLQFLNAADFSPVATGDYFLSTSESPERAVRALFAGLRNRSASPAQKPRSPVVPAAGAPAVEVSGDAARRPIAAPPEPRSLWSPRLQSWGLQEWGTAGRDTDTD